MQKHSSHARRLVKPLDEIRRVSVLGATGSIGTSTLDLLARNPDRFDVVAVTAQTNVQALATLAIAHKAQLAVIGHVDLYKDLTAALAGTGVRAAAGPDALIDAASEPADCVVAAMVGMAGLQPALAAVRQGRRVALANKECLVAAGDLFMREVARWGTELLPVDSEHSAAFQAMAGNDRNCVERITLTASGGPFLAWDTARMAAATPEEAVRHPKWSMGPKISVDSATLMNKGLELIEAHHLFGMESARLEAVIHPQSVVHCLVAYRDGSVVAQLSCPDMRTPIALSLAWPRRMAAPTERLDLVKLGALTFLAVDEARFPALGLARAAMALGSRACAALNAANEVAVAAFLSRRIGFLDIARVVDTSLDRVEKQNRTEVVYGLADVLAIDLETRCLAEEAIMAHI